MLVFALVGCIGDNDVILQDGGDGGGSVGEDPDDETGGSVDDDDGRLPEGNSSSGSGGGNADDDDDDAPADPCGDGHVASFEQCDDGNTIDGDGCESTCRITIGVAAFEAGGAHTCAVDYFGDVRCWGSNDHGQLGYATLGLEEVGAHMIPAVFGRSVSIGAQVRQVALGAEHTCALTVDGDIYCWGRNDSGQLGYGIDEDLGDDPGEAPSDIGPVAFDLPAIAVSAGAAHTCALFDDGGLRCWGDGRRGQLGIGDGFADTVGAGVAPYARAAEGPGIDMFGVVTRSVHVGVGDFGCIVDATGLTRCWGANESGQLGLGDDADLGVDVEPMQHAAILDEQTRRIAVGEAHVCLVNDKLRVQCFGRNDSGQLGYARVDDIGDDEEPLDGVVHLDGHAAKLVAAGADFSCALLDDGSVRCWGSGAYGQLGNGHVDTIGDDEAPADSPMFVAVPLMLPATHIDAGAHHVCARTIDASLHCWGLGADGRLGYGTDANVGDSPATLPVPAVPVY